MSSNQNNLPPSLRAPVAATTVVRDQVIQQLANSVDLKRRQLDQIYTDLNRPDDQGILKHVHFESISSPDASPTKPQVNNTSRVAKENKTISTSRTTVKVATSRIPKANTKPSTSNQIQSLRPVLTYQQKKQLEADKRARLEQQLVDLKQRIIARKFGYIWLRSYLYGKEYRRNKSTTRQLLLPSQLVRFRANQIMIKYTWKWRNDSRIQRNEWRMTVKAQCHFNYVLSNKIWNCWREYAAESKQEKQLDRVAIEHYNLKIRVKFWNEWKEYSSIAKRHKYTLLDLQEKKTAELVKECFRYWNYKLRSGREIHKINEIAERHSQLVLLHKCYSLWYFKFVNEKEERRKQRMARQAYRKTLLKKCFDAVRMYAIYRRKKAIQQKKIQEYFESQLVYRVYHVWYEKLQARMQMNQIEDEIVMFKNRFLKARAFEYWKSAYQYQIKLQIKQMKMVRLYHKKLKQKVYNVIKLNYDHAKQERTENMTAENFDIYWTKKRYFSEWQDRLESKNEVKTMHVAYKARRHHETRLLKSCLLQWKLFIIEERSFNVKNKAAEDLYQRNLSKKCFQSVKCYVEMAKNKRINYERALEFERTSVWTKYFAYWVHRYEETIETQMNTRIAILHYESRVKNNTITRWYMSYNARLKEEISESRAMTFYQLKLLKNSFKTWSQGIKEAKQEICHEEMAINHYNKSICYPVFQRWKMLYDQIQNENKKIEEMGRAYDKKLLKKHLNAWKAQTQSFKSINRMVTEMYKIKQKDRVAEMFHEWRLWVRVSKVEKENEQLATGYYLKQLMRKILLEWNSFVSDKIAKRENERDQIEKFQGIKDKLIARSVFEFWRKKENARSTERSKEAMAVDRFSKKLEKKLLESWKVYVVESKRKKLMESRADRFFEMRLKTEFYFKWTFKYDAECQQREKNERALLLWCINVQKKFFDAWRELHLFKKQKKERYKQALEQRQLDVLRYCARCFLKYATDARNRRIRYQFQYSAYDYYQLESKYFHIWRAKCRFRSPPVSVQRSDIQSIKSNPSLEKRDRITGCPKPIPTPEFQLNKVRPSPRKPKFLLDSVDKTKPQEVKDHQAVATSNEYQEAAPVLLPPTAFMLPASFVPLQVPSINLISASNSTISHREIQPLVVTTNPTITNKEEFFNMDFGFKRTMLPSPFDSSRSELSRLNSFHTHRTESNQITNELELIDIKKRLEALSQKADKLKRLKEQHAMLKNWIEASEQNQSSMCITIYEEKDQLEEEIKTLSREIKAEKHSINTLIKNNNLK